MLSYQHAYHAGNHADVIKHLCWLDVIEYLKRKNKPFALYDTHAGDGLYHLDDAMAQHNREFETGISVLSDSSELGFKSDLLRQYTTFCQPYYLQNQYPGSPLLAAQHLRNGDHLHAMELHPSAYSHLQKNLKNAKHGATHLHKRDGFEAVAALTPPSQQRGAVLIDPAYERVQEYSDVVNTVHKILHRWSQATILVWYPLLSSRAQKKVEAANKMQRQLADNSESCLEIRLIACENTPEQGMYGSAICVINPPWGMDERLQHVLNEAVQYFNSGASVEIAWLKSEHT